MGLSGDGDAAGFQRRRETEVKHGGVNMLATVGYIPPELTGNLHTDPLPSMGLKFEDVPKDLAAISRVPRGWLGPDCRLCLLLRVLQ